MSKIDQIPTGIFANILNNREVNVDRHNVENDTIPYIHVSSLIKSGSIDTFCPREFVLRYMEKHTKFGGAIPAKFEVLFEAGHALGDAAVNKFLRRSLDYGHTAFGDWECTCKETRITLERRPQEPYAICNHCSTPVINYAESDLRDDTIRIVGHPDFMMQDDTGRIYVFEIKSIDRADIDFQELEEPLGDHVIQASIYYWLLIKKGFKVHPYVRILYIDRSLQNIYTEKPYKELSVKRISLPRVRRIVNKAKRAYIGCKNGILPKRICDKIDCSRANNCKSAISCFGRTSKKIKRTS